MENKLYINWTAQRRLWRIVLHLVFFAMLALFALYGCAQKLEYKEVFLPQKCEVSKKTRPPYTQNLSEDVKNILIYTELLEADLKLCLGEKDE